MSPLARLLRGDESGETRGRCSVSAPRHAIVELVKAWYPDKGFGISVHGPDLGINVSDSSEIAAVAYLDIADRPTLDEVMERISEQEAAWHVCISGVIEETTVRAIYEVTGRYDFSSDETVEATRPR